MRKAFLPINAALAVGVLLVGTSYAQLSMDFPFSTSAALGAVDIQITATDQTPIPSIVGEETVQRTNTITNMGAECWIRAAHVLEWTDAEGKPQTVTIPEKSNLSSGWIEGQDGWLYYQTPMAPDSNLSFSEDLFNPEGDLWDGRQITVISSIEIQAVQTSNFTPDFTAEKPWGDISPEICLQSQKEATIDG